MKALKGKSLKQVRELLGTPSHTEPFGDDTQVLVYRVDEQTKWTAAGKTVRVVLFSKDGWEVESVTVTQ